ncbi:transposase [Streptosporangium canum]
MGETRRSFDPEFRAGAVRIVRESGKSIASVAKDLEINAGTLANWMQMDRLACEQDGNGELAEEIGVDPKTVERWVSTGRTPHPGIAHRAAAVLREDLAHLWPAIEQGRRRSRGSGELVAAHPTRSSAPLDM